AGLIEAALTSVVLIVNNLSGFESAATNPEHQNRKILWNRLGVRGEWLFPTPFTGVCTPDSTSGSGKQASKGARMRFEPTWKAQSYSRKSSCTCTKREHYRELTDDAG